MKLKGAITVLRKEAEFLAKLGDKELGKQLQNQSIQERLAAAQEKFIAAFEKLSPIIEAIVTPIADIAGFLASSKPLMDGIVKGALILAGIKFANFLGLGKSLGGIGGMLGGGGGATGAVGGAVMKETGKKVYGAAAQSAMKAGTAVAAKSSGGFFGGLLSRLNPMTAIKGAVKSAGGVGGFFKTALKKIPGLNTLLTGFFAYNDIKSLLENPVDENGKPLSKEQVNQQVGKIVAGGLGGILGGALGTALGGPVGTIVGSMGGDWLFKNLLGLFPDAAAGLGEAVTPFFEKAPSGGEIPAKDYVIKTLPEDTVVGAGGTKLGRTDEMVALLQELITVVKTGGNVYLDGNKVGTAMSVSAYKTQ